MKFWVEGGWRRSWWAWGLNGGFWALEWKTLMDPKGARAKVPPQAFFSFFSEALDETWEGQKKRAEQEVVDLGSIYTIYIVFFWWTMRPNCVVVIRAHPPTKWGILTVRFLWWIPLDFIERWWGDLGNQATFEWGRVLGWGLWRPNPTRKRNIERLVDRGKSN